MSARPRGYTIKDGKVVVEGQQRGCGVKASAGLTSNQKAVIVLAAILIGPALLKQLYDKLTAEQVDLSDFNIVSGYDKPAIEMMDNTVRIQYCAS